MKVIQNIFSKRKEFDCLEDITMLTVKELNNVKRCQKKKISGVNSDLHLFTFQYYIFT